MVLLLRLRLLHCVVLVRGLRVLVLVLVLVIVESHVVDRGRGDRG
jgi:hypothetical protein